MQNRTVDALDFLLSLPIFQFIGNDNPTDESRSLRIKTAITSPEAG
jgi:hypothetical protein